MTHASPGTIRSGLIGKRVVHIWDPYPHGDGLVPPSAYLSEFVVVEEDYIAVRELGSLDWMRGPNSFRPIVRWLYGLGNLEPGDRLERYLPGATAVFGTPDFVLFDGPARKKWDREHRTPTAS
jgi:hypothetical protein